MSSSSLREEIEDLEHATWRALQHSGASLVPYLTSDCIMQFPLGMKLTSRTEPSVQDILHSPAFIPWTSYNISKVDVTPAGPDAAVISYLVKAFRPPAGPEEEEVPFEALCNYDFLRKKRLRSIYAKCKREGQDRESTNKMLLAIVVTAVPALSRAVASKSHNGTTSSTETNELLVKLLAAAEGVPDPFRQYIVHLVTQLSAAAIKERAAASEEMQALRRRLLSAQTETPMAAFGHFGQERQKMLQRVPEESNYGRLSPPAFGARKKASNANKGPEQTLSKKQRKRLNKLAREQEADKVCVSAKKKRAAFAQDCQPSSMTTRSMTMAGQARLAPIPRITDFNNFSQERMEMLQRAPPLDSGYRRLAPPPVVMKTAANTEPVGPLRVVQRDQDMTARQEADDLLAELDRKLVAPVTCPSPPSMLTGQSNISGHDTSAETDKPYARKRAATEGMTLEVGTKKIKVEGGQVTRSPAMRVVPVLRAISEHQPSSRPSSAPTAASSAPMRAVPAFEAMDEDQLFPRPITAPTVASSASTVGSLMPASKAFAPVSTSPGPTAGYVPLRVFGGPYLSGDQLVPIAAPVSMPKHVAPSPRQQQALNANLAPSWGQVTSPDRQQPAASAAPLWSLRFNGLLGRQQLTPTAAVTPIQEQTAPPRQQQAPGVDFVPSWEQQVAPRQQQAPTASMIPPYRYSVPPFWDQKASSLALVPASGPAAPPAQPQQISRAAVVPATTHPAPPSAVLFPRSGSMTPPTLPRNTPHAACIKCIADGQRCSGTAQCGHCQGSNRCVYILCTRDNCRDRDCKMIHRSQYDLGEGRRAGMVRWHVLHHNVSRFTLDYAATRNLNEAERLLDVQRGVRHGSMPY